MKKILRIKTGEFLLEVREGNVVTTYGIKNALDISDWSFKQLEYIISNLHKVGYTKAEVIEYEQKENK
jgi:hypothetical protein